MDTSYRCIYQQPMCSSMPKIQSPAAGVWEGPNEIMKNVSLGIWGDQ